MYQRILIPLDGSPIAEQVLPLAKMLVVRFSSSVVLFQAIQPIGKGAPVEDAALHADDQVELWRRQAVEYLEGIAQGFPWGIAVQPEVRIGLPAPAILEFAESAHSDLIAMATHGRTGVQRWAYGSVADKVLSGGRLPVLLVRASEAPHTIASIRRILVPLDGSALAERALIPAQYLAQAFNAEVLLFRVQEPSAYGQGEPAAGVYAAAFDDSLRAMVEEYLTEKTQEMRSRDMRVSWETQFGMPADGILDVAQKRAVNLVVMSTHGRSGVGRWIMGSVADRVLRASRIPVLLIRSNAMLGEGSDL
jgi:nucleotide-binding universal stress UspA family protein